MSKNTSFYAKYKLVFPELKNKIIINKQNQSETKVTEYISSARFEKKMNNSSSDRFKIENNISIKEEKNHQNIHKALKTFQNIIKNLKYPTKIVEKLKYKSCHKQKDELILENKLKISNQSQMNLPTESPFLKSSIILKSFSEKGKREKHNKILQIFEKLNEVLSSRMNNIAFEIRKEILDQIKLLETNFQGLIHELLQNINHLKVNNSKDVEINSLRLKISQLNKEIKTLLENSQSNQIYVEEKEKSSNEGAILQEKYSDYFEKSQKIIKNHEQKINLLFSKCTAYKYIKIDLENKLQSIKEDSLHNLSYKTQNCDLRQKIVQINEIILMQNEEILTLKDEMQIKSLYFANAIASFKKKMLRNSSSILIPEEKKYFANDILNEVTQIISSQFSKTLDFSNTENINFEEIDLEKCKIFKPTFFHCFPKASFSNPIKNLLESSRNNMKLLITIRGILDSKHNEYLLSDNYKTYSNFADFVYSWLCNFYIDEEKRCVLHRNFQTNHEVAMKFVQELLDFNKTWELFTFKDFLEEKASPDEIFFYLHCRFLLFNGPQLRRLSGGFNYIDYVKFDNVLKVLDLVFKNFELQSKNFIINKLKAKSKNNGDIILIDSSLVLRIFLEYYKLERKLIYKLLYQNFLSKHKYLKDFKAFENFIQTMLPTCNDLEKMELYRYCYEVSKGMISPDVVFTVFSESGFLIKIIKSQYFYDEIYEKDYNIIIDFIHNNFKKKNEELLFIKSKIQSFGVEIVFEEFEKYQTIFLEKNFNFYKRNSFGGKNLFMIYSHFIEIFMKIRNIEVFNTYNTAEKEIFYLKNDFLSYDSLFVLIKTFVKMEKIKDFECQRNARKIQLNLKRKMNKWYALVSQILPSKIDSKVKI